MALINKSDLVYKDYNWSAYGNDDPKITGVPDSTLFNRKEGYEVLYLINKIVERNKFKQKQSGLKIERMIRKFLPGEIRSQTKVINWIETNWNNY